LVTDQRRTQGHQGQPQSIARKLVEAIYDKEVPSPLDEGKLNVKFVEYMMGLPEGWVTDVDLPRSQKLKILGNGVVPQQAIKTCGRHAKHA
jgi:DNA (cytosine-5)-methyltransferase 1